MPNPRVRSLNLATSVGVALYEALRQAGALGRG
jgi:tRNA(Leu) C34 or U34 (ribose-2'-O)-methylase TrmL